MRKKKLLVVIASFAMGLLVYGGQAMADDNTDVEKPETPPTTTEPAPEPAPEPEPAPAPAE